MDFANNVLQPGEVGELCSRGRHIMQGYLNKPDATREQIVQGMERNLCRCGAHPRILDAVRLNLEIEGYEVFEANNGREAIEAFERSAERYAQNGFLVQDGMFPSLQNPSTLRSSERSQPALDTRKLRALGLPKKRCGSENPA